MNYFRCTVGGSGKGNTVTVTCSEEFAGLTITLAKTGKTYTKTCPSTAPYVVTYYGVENGTYTVSCTVDGQTYSETVIVQDISCVLNYGFNWQIWVDTASQLDSSDYDTLDEVLADEKALRELFLEHACIDYMAEATSSNADLETIINDDYCAKWINNSDYALDYLYANEVIADLMDTADKYGYGEWALMPQVPKMTSNTAPYGEAFSSSDYSSNYPAWEAFDGIENNIEDRWASASSITNAQLGYKFINPICVKRVYIKTDSYQDNYIVQIQGSNDNTNWSNIGDEFTLDHGSSVYKILDNAYDYTYYRADITNFSGSSGVTITSLQFYAWAPKGNVPVMTGNSAPYGTAFAASVATSSYFAHFAFDGVLTSARSWVPAEGSTVSNSIVGYKFTNPVCVKRAAITTLGMGNVPNATFSIQGSNGNSNWTDLITGVSVNRTTSILATEVNISNNDYYLYYRLVASTALNPSSGNSLKIVELQFYGRELKVSVPIMTSNTAPFGEAFGNASSGGKYYVAFNKTYSPNNNATAFDENLEIGLSSNPEKHVGYDFKKEVVIKFINVLFRNLYTSSSTYKNDIKFQGSNDNESWDDIITGITVNPKSGSDNNQSYVYSIEQEQPYRYYRMYFPSAMSGSGWMIGLAELYMYGLDYSEKEFEAGTTKKWLYDHGVISEQAVIYKEGTGTAENNGNQFKFGTDGTSKTNYIGEIYAKLDLTPYSLARAKAGNELYTTWHLTVYNTEPPITISKWNSDTGMVGRTVVNASDTSLPNNIVLSTSNMSAEYVLTALVGHSSSSNRMGTITELWLE